MNKKPSPYMAVLGILALYFGLGLIFSIIGLAFFIADYYLVTYLWDNPKLLGLLLGVSSGISAITFFIRVGRE